MRSIGVIPARWKSTRLEGKVLADINGKPMIQYVWERACSSQLLEEVIIACDDERVFDAATGFGAKAVMTSLDHTSGTDRIAEAVQTLSYDIVVNIQGDEPLLDACILDGLIRVMLDNQDCLMATVIKKINETDLGNPNVVKVVIDSQDNALYFSRSVIPFVRDKNNNGFFYKHIGLYAYQKEFLKEFTKLPKGKLEQIEKLEQLRALEAGYKIKTILTERDTIGVDTPEDLQMVKELLAS